MKALSEILRTARAGGLTERKPATENTRSAFGRAGRRWPV